MSIFLELLEMKLKPISPLLLEVLIRELPKCHELGMSDVHTLDYIVKTYKTIMGEVITPEDAAAILRHLVEESSPSSPEEGGAHGKAPAQRTFATQFAKFLDNMELDDCCFILAHGDPEKAGEIYRKHDYRLVKAMRNTWQQLEMQKAQLMLESMVYGMGGGFGESDENTEFYDLTTGDIDVNELNGLMKFH